MDINGTGGKEAGISKETKLYQLTLAFSFKPTSTFIQKLKWMSSADKF